MANTLDLPQVTVTSGSTAATSSGVILDGRIAADDEIVVKGISARIASVAFVSGQNWAITLRDAWPAATAAAVAGYVRIKAEAARFTEDVTEFITLLDQMGLWVPTTGVPQANVGKDGDVAMDAVARLFYQKTEGAWVALGSITGSMWIKGTVVPTAAQGKDNDLYLRTTNGDLYYKTGGAWAVIMNLMGPIGPAPVISGTSTTSTAIATGSKTFTVASGIVWVVGQRLRIAATASPTINYMEGVVTAKAATAVTVLVDLIGGTGTLAAWTIGIAGNKGADGNGAGDMTKALFAPNGQTSDVYDRANHTGTQEIATIAGLAGEVVMLAGGTIPIGRRLLKLNGASLSRATYSDLWAYAQTNLAATEAAQTPAQFGPGNGTTTFSLPDWRGYFIRAWDDGRGIDAARVISAIQAQQLGEHLHSLPIGWDANSGYLWNDGSGQPAFGSDVIAASVAAFAKTAPAASSGRFGKSGGASAPSTENRPINLATLFAIRF